MRKNRKIHKLKIDDRIRLYFYAGRRRWTWTKFMRLYSQPRWCHYHGALHGMLGCWSLSGLHGVDAPFKNKCSDCELSDYHKEGTNLKRGEYV